jgi:hypothetical protein
MLRNSSLVIHTSVCASDEVTTSSMKGISRTKRWSSTGVRSSGGGACGRT